MEIINKERKECEGCIECDPYSYFVEVDALFLHHVKNAYDSLQKKLPQCIAIGWIKELDEYIKKLKLK